MRGLKIAEEHLVLWSLTWVCVSRRLFKQRVCVYIYIVEEELYEKEAEVINTWNPEAACQASKLLWEPLLFPEWKPRLQALNSGHKTLRKTCFFFSPFEVGKMREVETNIFWKRPNTQGSSTHCYLTIAFQGREARDDSMKTEMYTFYRSWQQEKNPNCHLRITFYSYRLHCKPSTSLIARCCWQPSESSAQQNQWSEPVLHSMLEIGRCFV